MEQDRSSKEGKSNAIDVVYIIVEVYKRRESKDDGGLTTSKKLADAEL